MMSSLDELVQWAKGVAKKHPKHRDEIWSFISLCQDEVSDGGSEPHEVQLAYNDICDLVGIDE
jgi:hypothetical protein